MAAATLYFAYRTDSFGASVREQEKQLDTLRNANKIARDEFARLTQIAVTDSLLLSNNVASFNLTKQELSNKRFTDSNVVVGAITDYRTNIIDMLSSVVIGNKTSRYKGDSISKDFEPKIADRLSFIYDHKYTQKYFFDIKQSIQRIAFMRTVDWGDDQRKMQTTQEFFRMLDTPARCFRNDKKPYDELKPYRF